MGPDEHDFTGDDPVEPDRTPVWVTAAVVAFTALIGVAYWQMERASDAREARARAKAPVLAAPIVTWRGKTIRKGDTVRIYKWAGTFKPDETGYPHEIDAAPYRTGIVLGGEQRQNTFHLDIDPAEPIQIVRVRWHRQSWKVNGRDQTIELGEFEATIHVDHLEVRPSQPAR